MIPATSSGKFAASGMLKSAGLGMDDHDRRPDSLQKRAKCPGRYSSRVVLEDLGIRHELGPVVLPSINRELGVIEEVRMGTAEPEDGPDGLLSEEYRW